MIRSSFNKLATALCMVAIVASPPLALHARAADPVKMIKERKAVGLHQINSVRLALVDIFSKFIVVQPVRSLIYDPIKFPARRVSRVNIEPQLGIYREVSTGAYSFEPRPAAVDSLPTISLEQLNGIDVSLTILRFDGLDNVAELQIAIRSNSRAITTPLTAQVSGDFTQTYIDWSGDASSPLTGHSVVLQGRLDYVDRDKKFVQYALSRENYAANELDRLQVHSSFRLQEANGDIVLPAVTQHSIATEVQVFGDPRASGQYVLTSQQFNYKDVQVQYSLQLEADTTNVAQTNKVSYTVNGGAVLGGITFGKFTNGSYECDISDPSVAGSGQPILLEWVNNSQEKIVPSVKFPCSRLVRFTTIK